MQDKPTGYTNLLIQETSPYLLQHAHNPVEWHAWNDKTLDKAKSENKLILISIGYSACHWCHVMEHESFEDEEVAKLMNDNFIWIKVDREERPDVDNVYMDAIHLMGGRGGWPLNCFALPDGRPFWGGTYFAKSQWISILGQIAQVFKTQKAKLEEHASDIAEGIRRNNLYQVASSDSLSREMLAEMVDLFSTRFDVRNGGTKGAPKFPMPNNLLFLLRYYARTKKSDILKQIELTLHKMASGGIYDQLGGGFSRYSVDDHWHVPHFEKMLYDNAQLVTLYSEAYQLTKKDFYKEVIIKTIEFVNRELTRPEGGFYCALDADSEGEEGKFYVWKNEEIESLAGSNADIVKDYFGIDQQAVWEEGKNVLIKAISFNGLANKYNKPLNEIEEIISDCRQKLLLKRSERVRPGLDNKILTSWNAMMMKGYVDAFISIGNQEYLEIAIRNAAFILSNLKNPDGGLFHNYKNGGSTINGFLEDFAFVIEVFISLYLATFDEKWVNEAKSLMDYCFEHFYDSQTGMFYFTSDENKDLFPRKFEITDNVISSSNSSIANSLFLLSQIYEDSEYLKIAENMLKQVTNYMVKYPSAYSNWGIFALNLTFPFYSVMICGENAFKIAGEISKYFLPNILLAVSFRESGLPMFKSKFIQDKTLIHVCSGSECLQPMETAEEFIRQIF